MLFRLVRPVKRPESSKFQFAQRIPADVQAKAPGLTLSLPIGDEIVTKRIGPKARVVKASLRTNDPSEAKIRQAAVAAYLEGVWQSLRKGPVTLSHKQAVAIAGEVYGAWTEAFEDEPGTPELWQAVQEANAAAKNGAYGRAFLAIGDDDKVRLAMEHRFGFFVDRSLAKRGLIVSTESRTKVLRQVALALDLAATTLERRAQGDYSPDDFANRFPKWEEAKPGVKVPLRDLLEGWWKEAQANGKTASTYESYSRSVRLFTAFLKHDDAAKVTAEDVVAFKDHRLSQLNPRTGKPVSPKTVKDSDLVALKSLFSWGVSNRKVSTNPAQGVTVRMGRKAQARPKFFSEAEAASILRLSASHQGGHRENPKTAAAKRWVPWLCAYTGARMGEMAQLRKEDVRQVEGYWAVHISPEAGRVKTKEARDVPLHPHLLETGFLDFVRSSRPGYLFLNVSSSEEPLGKLKALGNRLQDFVRTVVPDKGVSPNHGWRHTFKTIATEEGLSDRVVDAIQGHAPRTQGDSYVGRTIKAKARVMEAFPRYKGV